MRDDDLAGLAADLRALAAHLDVPEPADQRTAVRDRLAARPPRRPAWQRVIPGVRDRLAARPPRRPAWQRIVPAVRDRFGALPPRGRARRWIIAAVVAVVGTVAVVAPARAAVVTVVGDLLRVAGISVRTQPHTAPSLPALSAQPSLPARPSPLPAETPASLAEARRSALFPVREPAGFGPPEEVLLADPDRSGAPRVVTMTYRGGTVRLDQLDGAPSLVFMKTAPEAEWVDIGAEAAIWLPAPHAVTYVDRDGVERTVTARLAGPTLIWQEGKVTYRLEGVPTLEEARKVALSVR